MSKKYNDYDRTCYVNYSIAPVQAEYAESLYEYLMNEVCMARLMADESLSLDTTENHNSDVITVVRYQFGTKTEANWAEREVGEEIAHYVDAWIKANAVTSPACS